MLTSLALTLLSALPSAWTADSGAPLGAVEWFRGRYSSARNRAEAQGKWTIVAFWMDGSPWSRRLIDDTFGDAAVADRLDGLMCLNVDLTRRADGTLLDQRAKEYTTRFPVAILPSIFLVSPDGRLEDVLTGYIPPQPFLAEIDRIQGHDRTLTGFERAVDSSPEDIAGRLSLAQKYEDLGDLAARDIQLTKVKELDPAEVSLPVRRRNLSIVRESMTSLFNDDEGIYDTTPLEEFLDEEEHPELLVEGWSYLADLYPRVDRAEDGRMALQFLWRHIAEPDRMNRGSDIARILWEQREDLAKGDRKFALEVASKVAALARKTVEEPTRLAEYLDPLACCYYMNGKRAAAIKTIEICIDLAPDEPSYAVRREIFKLRK